MRNAGVMTEGTVEGRSTTGKVRRHDKRRDCGVGVETEVAVGRSRLFCLESGFSGVESENICGLRLRPGVAGYHPSTVDDFGRTAVYRLENITGISGRKGEWQHVEIKYETSFSDEIPSDIWFR